MFSTHHECKLYKPREKYKMLISEQSLERKIDYHFWKQLCTIFLMNRKLKEKQNISINSKYI